MKLSRLLSTAVLGFLLAISAPGLQAQVGNNNPTGPSGSFNGNVTTGCSYDPYTGNNTRAVMDMGIYGAVGEYGLSFSRTWNSRTPGWRTSYDWSIDEITELPYTDPIAYTVHFPDGRMETFTSAGAQGGYWPTTAGVRERFKPWDGTFAYLILPDGGKVQFQVTRTANWNGETHQWLYDFSFTAVALIDPYGLVTTFSDNPDGSFQVTEPAGRWIKVYYTLVSGDPVIDYIKGSDNREVHYTWQTQYFGIPSLPHAVLTSVVYFFDPSLTATYTYSSTRQGHVLLATANDPMYAGPLKNISYDYKANPNPDGSAQVAGQIQNEKSGLTGDTVTTLTVTGPTTRTETRGDGRQRTFTYDTNGYLLQWTDFKGVSSYQSYDSKKYVASITDGNGHTTNFTNDPLTGLVTQIQYPATPTDTTPSSNARNTVNYTYGSLSCPDPNNRDPYYPYYLYSVTDEAGNATTFTRDTNKRVTRIDYADGGYETFSYNSFGRVLTHRMKTGGIESFTYSPTNGLRQDYRSPDNASGNPTARYGYDSVGRLSAVTDVFGLYPADPYHTTTYQYNARGQITLTTLQNDPVDGLPHTITNAYNLSEGTLSSVTDQLGHVTTFSYDDYRRRRSMTTPLRAPGDSTPRTTYFSYDRTQGTADDYTHTDSNVTRLTLPSGNIVQATHDENYRKKDVIASSGSGADSAKTSYGFDYAGNLTSMVAPDEQPGGAHQNLSASWAYDERNRLMSVTDPLNHVMSYTYDLGGHKKTLTQPNTQVTTFDAYDSMNRLLQQTVQQGGTLNAVTQYTYEPATGLHMTMKDPHLVQSGSGEVYTFEYDVMGRPTSLTYPPPTPGGARTELRTYDTAGRLQTYTNRDGKVQTFSYDNLHRPTGFTWSAGSAPNVTFLYDVASRTTAINTADATISRTYFDDNLLKTETETPVGGSANTVTYAWNADGNRESILYPSGRKYRYNYTGRNQLKQVQDNNSFFYQAEYVYDVNGNVATRKVGVNVASASMTTDASQRDALGRCTHLAHQFPAGSGGTRSFDYVFDAMSNRTSITRDAGTADLYDYDLAEQVKTGVDGGIPHSYGYDANGNRTAMDGIGTYVTNDLNQQTIFDGFAVNYDNNGNVTASGAGNLSSGMYDAQNRLTGVTFGTTQTTTFKYDGLNRKISQTVGGATTYNVWDGWNLIEERGTGNTLLNSYVYGAGEIIERISGAGTHFYYQDGLGSTSHLADAAGALQESYKYNTFGQVTVYAPAGTVRKGGSQYDVRHLFTGQLWMPQSGLYDYRNRIFSPSLTRFLQPDPIGFAGDSSNLYRYCGNNAMNATDPLGFDGHRPTSSPQVWKKPLEPKTPYQVYNGQGEILDPGGPGRDSNAGVGDRVTVGWPGGTGAWGDAWDGGFDRTAGSGDFGPGDRNGAGPSGDGGQGGGGPYSGHITVNWWPQSLTFPYPGPPVSPEQAAWTDKGRVPTLIVATIIFAPELLAPEALPALMPSKRALETLRVVLQVLLKKQGPPKTPTLPEPFPPGIEEPWLPPPPP